MITEPATWPLVDLDDLSRAALFDETLLLASPDDEDQRPAKIGPGQLWAYACRGPADVPVLALERALRQDERLRAGYRSMLAARAVAVSERALAAASGGSISRRVGRYGLALHGEPPSRRRLVTIEVPPDAPAPTMVDVIDEADAGAMLRLPLGAPINGMIHLAFDLDSDGHAAAVDLIARPTASIFLA